MKKHDHITAVLIDLNWLPIKQWIEYKLLLLTFRSLHGLAASYITDLLIRYEPTRALRSADIHLLEVPRCRLHTQGEKAFSSAAPRLWNNLGPLVCVPQTPSVLSRSHWRHFCLKERFHFKITILKNPNIFNMYYLWTISLFNCNITIIYF